VAYRVAAIPLTLSDRQGFSPVASLSKWNFCTAVQHLTRFQLTLCMVWSLCDSWASCWNWNSAWPWLHYVRNRLRHL